MIDPAETNGTYRAASAIAAFDAIQVAFAALVKKGILSKAEAEQILRQAIETIKTGGAGDQAAELLASLWKRFPNLSRHLGSKAIEEDRSYGHYTIFGTRPDIAALRLLSVQLLANSSIVGQTRARNSRMGSARWRHAICHLQALANT